jgi:AcrR family transcriptional regulator
MASEDPAGAGEAPVRGKPLHGGRHSLSADLVAFDQRERLLAALARVVAEEGYNKATIGAIAEAAAVSRRTFYEHFKGKEECFLAAYDALDDYLVSLVEESVSADAEGPDRVAATLATVVSFLAEHRDLARVYVVEPNVVAGERMAARREARAERYIELLEPGRRWRDGDRDLAEGIEEAIFGGIITLLARRIVAGEGDDLARFAPAVIEFALAPYVGTERSREIAAAQG